MKKINYIYSFAAVFLLLAASCKDDDLVKPDYEKYNGNEVCFTASVDGKAVTRTYFGNSSEIENGNTVYPLYWSSDDRIVVASPMGESGRNSAVYDIQVPDNYATDPATFAAGINLATQVNPAGVQWSESNEKGQFYAIYPYQAETRRRPESLGTLLKYHNTISLPSGNNGASATALALVEKDQRIWAPPTTKAKPLVEGSDGPNVINMHGSNHANTMWAMTTNVEKGKTVNLRFKPLSTCLMMTFTNGQPQVSPQNQKDAMIEQIQICAPKGTNIAGVMNIQFPDINTTNTIDQIPNGGDATCTLVKGATYEKSNELCQADTITIHPWILATTTDADGNVTELPNGIHPTLKPGEQLLVEAFLLPTEEWQITSDWTVRVQLNGRTFERPLVGAGQNLTLKKGQIHEIDYPGFFVDYEWNYNAQSWMKDIPDDTYLTQLTLPGTWYSYSQNLDNPEPYQYTNWNLIKQLDEGVRAFELSTRTGSPSGATDYWNEGWLGSRYNDVFLSGTGSNNADGYYVRGTSVTSAIETIANRLKNYPTEMAVIVINYETGGNAGQKSGAKEAWLHCLEQCINNVNAETQGMIYGWGTNNTEKVDANTTLGDVRGRIVLKVNMNADNIIPTGQRYNYNGTIPAMMSFGTLAWISKLVDENGNDVNGEDLANTSLTSEIYWKEWNNDWTAKLIMATPKLRPGVWAFNWSGTNRTRVNPDPYTAEADNAALNDSKLPSYKQRLNSMTVLKDESIKVYKELYHDEWFQFGFGGTVATSNTSSNPDPEAFAAFMNPELLNMIQTYFDNNTPCPMGIVFFNQVGNPTYKGDEILAKLIKMNSAFYLQQRPNSGGSSGTQTTSVKSASPNHASGYTTSNGWSVF